ncbi:MAG: HAD-IIA family hydrolase [Sporomusaceae bacterium]|nr:HAD-IIA family hydrolase [Sporomusaceae bacterium]
MQQLKDIKCFVLDMDGTIYLGEKLLPGAKEFLAYLEKTGRDFLFLTNNSANDAVYYAQKLAKLGIECQSDNILTSGEATALYLKNNTQYRKIYLLGTPVLEAEFKRHGFILTVDAPDCVVLGFDMTLTYEKLATACQLIRNKTPFIATHPDFNCPTETGYIPDCGSMTALITASTEVSPQLVIGKPNKEIIEAFLKKKNYALPQMAIVGDRLYTDIATGVNAGITSVLVLSGESKLADAEKSEIKPDYIFANIGALGAALRASDNNQPAK